MVFDENAISVPPDVPRPRGFEEFSARVAGKCPVREWRFEIPLFRYAVERRFDPFRKDRLETVAVEITDGIFSSNAVSEFLLAISAEMNGG